MPQSYEGQMQSLAQRLLQGYAMTPVVSIIPVTNISCLVCFADTIQTKKLNVAVLFLPGCDRYLP